MEKTQKARENGSLALAKELESIAQKKDDPRFYSWLAWMYEPIDKMAIEFEIERQKSHNHKEASDYKSSLLENLDNILLITDTVSSNHYFKLAFEGYMKSAINEKNPDSMSVLADMYSTGKGTEMNLERSKYWLDQCNIIKTGFTFNEWKEQNKSSGHPNKNINPTS